MQYMRDLNKFKLAFVYPLKNIFEKKHLYNVFANTEKKKTSCIFSCETFYSILTCKYRIS